MNQPEVQHMEGWALRVAVQLCQPAAGRELGYWGPPHACGTVPILQRVPCGYGGLWPRMALFGAGLQPYSAHLWCCTAVLSQCFHFLVESVLKSQPQPKNNTNLAPLLLPSPHTLLPAFLLASHNVTKGKNNTLQHRAFTQRSEVPACPAASHPSRAGISELPSNLVKLGLLVPPDMPGLLACLPGMCGVRAGVFSGCTRNKTCATGEHGRSGQAGCIRLSRAITSQKEPCEATLLTTLIHNNNYNE